MLSCGILETDIPQRRNGYDKGEREGEEKGFFFSSEYQTTVRKIYNRRISDNTEESVVVEITSDC